MKTSLFFRSFSRIKKNKVLLFGTVFTGLLFLLFLSAPVWIPYDPVKMELSNKLIAPCPKFLFGTDHMGRDVFSRVLAGGKDSLGIALGIVSISTLIGLITGIFMGYVGGIADFILMRIVDVLLAFPVVVFALAVSAVLGSGQKNLMIAVSLVQWTRYARVARGETILLKQREFVEAARAIGNSNAGIMIRYLLPNVISKVLVLSSLDVGAMILYCASFSFLGVGTQPPTPDWGVMISEGKEYLRYAPWISFFPGIFIAFSSFAFHLIGDGIRDELDPRLTEKRNGKGMEWI